MKSILLAIIAIVILVLVLLKVDILHKEDLNDSYFEPQYIERVEGELKSAGNARFDFWFDMPLAWRAIDRSANGDGYFILIGDPNVDMRIYGHYKAFSDEEYLKTVGDSYSKVEKFEFKDGIIGIKASSTNAWKYVRNERDRRLVLSAKAEKKWLEENRLKVDSVAASIRSGVKRKNDI